MTATKLDVIHINTGAWVVFLATLGNHEKQEQTLAF